MTFHVPWFVALAACLTAYNLGRGDVRGALGAAVLGGLVWAVVAWEARRRVRRRSWRHDPVMVRPHDWSRD